MSRRRQRFVATQLLQLGPKVRKGVHHSRGLVQCLFNVVRIQRWCYSGRVDGQSRVERTNMASETLFLFEHVRVC